MNDIISSEQLEQNTVFIRCGNDQGTGFYVSTDIVLTAYHVLDDHFYDGKSFTIDGVEYGSTDIVASDVNIDLCLIKVDNGTGSGLPLHISKQSFKQPCSVFGFPYISNSSGDHFKGKIDKIESQSRWDFSFNCENVQSDINYRGLSGSPVISDGKIIGVTLLQKETSLRAISIRKVRDFITENNIAISEEIGPDDIPEQLRQSVIQSTPNFPVVEELTVKLKSHRGWFLTYGSPGSGKTTFVAGYKSTEENTRICGRYFTKIPEDSLSNVRISVRHFTTWIEDCVRDVLNISIDNETDLEKRIIRIPQLFSALKQKDLATHFVFLVDGLDEVNDLQSFLSVLPNELPENISFVLSCTSKEILPISIRAQLTNDKVVKVIPLDLGQCLAILIEKFQSRNYKIEDLNQMAIKSEGHPLYLRYLSEYVLSHDTSRDDLEVWIEQIPVIEGEISRYYESLWSKFYTDETKLWILITLAQLRMGVIEQDLTLMLPQQYQLSFISNFQPIHYLLNIDDEGFIEMYHNSFKNFIISKVPQFNKISNDNIAQFCLIDSNHRFSIENKLYHELKSNTPENAILNCNQEWADFLAFQHVGPDLIIFDIKNIIGFATDSKKINDIIRLLLLLQRVEFRYDSVFADNSTHLVAALISLEEYPAALTYIVRENTLLVSDSDAVEFLKILYEKKAFKEADKLYEAMDFRYAQFIHEFTHATEGDEINFQPFIYRSNALMLSEKTKGENQIWKSMQIIGKLKGIQNSYELHDLNASSHIYQVREHAASWNYAYMLRSLNLEINSQQLKEKSGVQIDQKWARMKALSILRFDEMNNYSSDYIEENESFYKTVEDLEWLIENYGTENDNYSLSVLAQALIENSKRFDLIEPLINEHLTFLNTIEFSIRDENGVDVNYKNVHSLYLRGKCTGYLAPGGRISIPDPYTRSHSWEAYYIKLIECIGTLEGILARKRQSNENIDQEYEVLKRTVNATNLSLAERARWERSYLLPEDIYPLIFEKLAHLFVHYFENKEGWLVNYILSNAVKQVGIYTEGYRSLLGYVIQTFCKYDKRDQETESLIDLLRDHVEQYVENRWERTPELMKVVEYYGLIRKQEKAKNTFLSMLRTSMGPSWYKEAQLQLLNRTYRLQISDGERKMYSRKFAGLLDCASGEMTFQRYIRHAKEDFVGDLVSAQLFHQGIEYLKFETIPPVDVVVKNAENNALDNLAEGFGYQNGARNITIQSGVLSILENAKELSPYIKFSLSHIFLLNDDLSRYLSDFAEYYANSINQIVEPQHRMLAYDFLIQTLNAEELAEDKDTFFSLIIKALKNEYYDEFRSFQDKIPSIKFPPSRETMRPKVQDEPTAFDDNHFKDFINECSKKAKDEKSLLKQGVEAFEKEKISIWMSNWSNASSEARNCLKLLLSDSEKTIETLSSFIKNPGTTSWMVVDQLIWFSENCLSESECETIYSSISDHFDLLIRPEQKYFQKYDWILNDREQDANRKVFQLIIWLLDHPLEWISNRTKDLVVFLIKTAPETALTCLIEATLSSDPFANGEKCSKILLDASNEVYQEFIAVIKQQPELIERILQIPHFTILYNYMKLAENLKSYGHEVFFESIEKIFSGEPKGKNGEVALEEDMLYPIEGEINVLNEFQILNRDFCTTLLQQINGYVSPLDWEDFEKSDEYLKRSYHENRFYDGRYSTLTRHALNVAIKPRIGQSNYEKVYEIINSRHHV